MILRSSYLCRIVGSAGQYSLPGASSTIDGTEGYWFSARILDDLALCRTRAWFSARGLRFVIPHRGEAERRGKDFVGNLGSALEEASGDGSRILLFLKEPRLRLVLERNVVINCRPDAFCLLDLDGRVRGLVVEAAETRASYVWRRRYMIPRLLAYMTSAYLEWEVPIAALYVSLVDGTYMAGLLVTAHRSCIHRPSWLGELARTVSAEEPPPPNPWGTLHAVLL